MEHYFIPKDHKDSDYFYFNDNVLGVNLKLKSVDSVFSKNQVDLGSRVLLESIDKNIDLSGDVLDLGCGYGVIGIVLKNIFDINITMSDVNSTAIDLAKQNTKSHGVNADIIESNLYENIDKTFDYIVTNPPIKVGKQILFNVVTNAYDKLNNNGSIILVIRKDHGQDSMKKHMQSVFQNVKVLSRDKGYYIMMSKKIVK